MDRLLVLQVVCAALVVGYFVLRYRRERFRRAMRVALAEYFAGRTEVGELGRRARETVGRSFLGGNACFAESISADQRAVDAARAGKRPAGDEAKLVRLLAALKNEFGLTERYQIEGWRAGRE